MCSEMVGFFPSLLKIKWEMIEKSSFQHNEFSPMMFINTPGWCLMVETEDLVPNISCWSKSIRYWLHQIHSEPSQSRCFSHTFCFFREPRKQDLWFSGRTVLCILEGPISNVTPSGKSSVIPHREPPTSTPPSHTNSTLLISLCQHKIIGLWLTVINGFICCAKLWTIRELWTLTLGIFGTNHISDPWQIFHICQVK